MKRVWDRNLMKRMWFEIWRETWVVGEKRRRSRRRWICIQWGLTRRCIWWVEDVFDRRKMCLIGGGCVWWVGDVFDGREMCLMGGRCIWWVGDVFDGREMCLMGVWTYHNTNQKAQHDGEQNGDHTFLSRKITSSMFPAWIRSSMSFACCAVIVTVKIEEKLLWPERFLAISTTSLNIFKRELIAYR